MKRTQKPNHHKKKKSSSSTFRFVILLLIIAFLCVGITAMLYSSLIEEKPFEVKRLPYDFVVKDSVGINLDTDILHFGGGPAGSQLQRSLNLTSQNDAFVVITWQGEGDVGANKNDFLLLANYSQPVKFVLTIPEGLPNGNYTGEIIFSFFKP
jgi:hypothetical protein